MSNALFSLSVASGMDFDLFSKVVCVENYRVCFYKLVLYM